ncbi:MAG: NAD(P)/FAD-dependent oxidoreductase [Haloferacaceae archaeon]
MRVAVLGAGYAGLRVARRLERSLPEDATVVVVDDTGTHLLQHEIHRVVRRPSVAEAIEVPLRDVLDRAEVRTARVTDVDPEAGVAELDGDESLGYDYGVVCLGATTAYHGLPGVREHSTPLKDVADARAIRESFLDLCATGGRAVVGGAGLSGVQVAGELTALARERDAETDVEVVLVERLESVAPSFPAHFREAVQSELVARGVEVRTGVEVTRATDEAVEFERDALAYDLLVWTGGIAGSEAMAGERPRVRDTLRHTESTFVVGDAARVVDTDGRAVPASAASAVREAAVAADNVAALARRGTDPGAFDPRLDHYRFDVPGWVVSVGEGAVAQVGPTVLTGRAAKALKTSISANQLTAVAELERAVAFVEEERRA